MRILSKLISILKENEIYKKEKDDFIKEYSPWYCEQEKSICGEFIESVKEENDFSWLEIDSALEDHLVKLKVKIPSNVKYGIPIHTHGDFETAKLFVCLVNPNICLKDKKKPDSVKKYFDEIDEETRKKDDSLNLDNFDETFKLEKHIVSLTKKIVFYVKN